MIFFSYSGLDQVNRIEESNRVTSEHVIDVKLSSNKYSAQPSWLAPGIN